ncbi:hypothetical protein LCGC14_0507810 [marine sediment metagenome]|uniref:LVIVD repeat protein n=1 Tax=marine sediment metagenome TaxID=412755 RepID=A0A0F9S6X9_9ZZZZ
MLSLNSNAQTNQMYLNRVGFINLEVGYDVHVVGDYAYVTNDDGLMIVDISNPSKPVKVGEVNIAGGALTSQISDDIAYISSVTPGFIITNISDPQNPQIIGQTIDASSGYQILISGSLAYVSHESSGLSIFNISDPSNPIGVDYEYNQYTTGLEIVDSILYVGNPVVGLRIYNISNPTDISLIKTIPGTSGIFDIHITNDIMFLACHQYGIKVFDITIPTSPSLLDIEDEDDSYEEEGKAYGLVERDELLYVADFYGVEVFNVTDPTEVIEIVERSSDVSAAYDIAVDDEYIYVALSGGLLILKLSTTPESSPPDLLLPIIIIIIISVVIFVVGITVFLYLRFIRFRFTGKKVKIKN